jgi:hypothetical protein
VSFLPESYREVGDKRYVERRRGKKKGGGFPWSFFIDIKKKSRGDLASAVLS